MAEIFYPTGKTVAIYRQDQNTYAENVEIITNFNQIVSDQERILQTRAKAAKVTKDLMLSSACLAPFALASGDVRLYGGVGGYLAGAAAIKIITWTDGTKIAGMDKDVLIDLIGLAATASNLYAMGSILFQRYNS
jgi:hypothetical protein